MLVCLPIKRTQENETAIDFASRTKTAICREGGLVDLEWLVCVADYVRIVHLQWHLCHVSIIMYTAVSMLMTSS